MRKNKLKQAKSEKIASPKPLVVFRCRSCGVPISKPVRLGYEIAHPIEWKVESAPVKVGFYGFGDTIIVGQRGTILNVADLHDTVSVPDIGCCGQSGSKINVLCVNRHPVATEFSDCMTSPHVVLEAEKVRCAPKSEE